MLNIVVLVSGGGTNLQALIDAQQRGEIHNGRICAVISSAPDAFALKRAEANGIRTFVINRREYPDSESFSSALLDQLQVLNTSLVVLAGFMTILSKEVSDAYENRIINVHPALIPSFCGKGYYGLHVHEAALKSGVKLTGATVHFVNEEADAGPIILQKAVAVQDDDTPQSLQQRVMEEAEWEILPRAVSLFCQGRIQVSGGRTILCGQTQRKEGEQK